MAGLAAVGLVLALIMRHGRKPATAGEVPPLPAPVATTSIG